MSLDVYSKVYIPAWLINVNRPTASSHHIYLDPRVFANDFQAERYISTFSGSDVWAQQDTDTKTKESARASPSTALSEHCVKLIELLKSENEALVEQARGWTRYSIAGSRYLKDLPTGDREHTLCSLYEFTIEGIAEFTPTVYDYDEVVLRQLIPSAQGFDQFVFHGRVYRTLRAAGTVIVETPNIFEHSLLFNIEFPYTSRFLTAQINLLTELAECNREWITSYCFPENKHHKLKTQLSTYREFAWKDQYLNNEQKKAVQEIIEHRYGEVPYLISGPPGTGKTKTVIEAILQILKIDDNARIIACGASKTAADTLALRLAKTMEAPSTLLRLNSSSRSFAEVPGALLIHSYMEHERFTVPKFNELMSKRVIVATCEELEQLRDIHCTNRSIARLERFMVNLLYAKRMLRNPRVHFTHLFIDEAAQATEPGSLSAFAIVEPESSKQVVSVILAGDHQQLGPRIQSELARSEGLAYSMFERLIKRPCYAEHPFARHKILVNPRPQLPFVYPAFTNLFRNYRSHPSILMVPSQLSYSSSLMPCAEKIETIAKALNSSFAVLFIGHDSKEETENLNLITSWYNRKEVEIIVEQVRFLVSRQSVEIRPHEIIVLAPFREQVVRLRMALRAVGYRDVGVGLVEDYQGAEARIVIVSVVRTQERFLPKDRLHGSGLIHERRRVNVAITRAKEFLIVVGSPALLCKDESWKAWLAFCKRNKRLTGQLPDELLKNLDELSEISSLENAYNSQTDAKSVLGSASDPGDYYAQISNAMLSAGHAARVVLE